MKTSSIIYQMPDQSLIGEVTTHQAWSRYGAYYNPATRSVKVRNLYQAKQTHRQIVRLCCIQDTLNAIASHIWLDTCAMDHQRVMSLGRRNYFVLDSPYGRRDHIETGWTSVWLDRDQDFYSDDGATDPRLSLPPKSRLDIEELASAINSIIFPSSDLRIITQ
jgi:hypothetical protein